MVNTNIQGVVPINGRGFTAKIKRNFGPGEYRVLSNARLEDGILQTRYNINHYIPAGNSNTPLSNAHPFVGFIDEFVVAVSRTQQVGYKKGSKITMWAPTALSTDAHASSFHRIVGVFEYNNMWCWLTWKVTGSTGVSNIYLYTVDSTTKTSADLSSVVFADLTQTLLFSYTSKDFVFDNFFVYKERLWVTTNQGLYFSKATDPKTFAVPDGGFFRLRDQNINYAFPHKDNIFMLCDTSIHSISYSTDPNTDGYVKEVTNVLGADHGTSHGDQAYVVNTEGVYAVSSSSIDLVRDDFEVGVTTSGNKLVSWENYLIVIKYSNHTYSSSGSAWPLPFKDAGRIRAKTFWALDTLVDSNVWFIDMLTGACHTLDFTDQLDTSGLEVRDRGHITDMIVNPNKDFDRTNGLTLMTNKCNGNANDPGYAQFYLMDNVGDNFFIYDTVVNSSSDNIIRQMKPNIKIEFHAYTPDGNEYLMKKFRNLQLMGNFSFWDFEVLIAYDNEDYDDAKAIEFIADLPAIETAGTKRSPYPARIGLNQRARSISIMLRTKDPEVPMDGDPNIYERVEITDVRVLWTYTGRGPTHLTQSATT